MISTRHPNAHSQPDLLQFLCNGAGKQQRFRRFGDNIRKTEIAQNPLHCYVPGRMASSGNGPRPDYESPALTVEL